eukprot:TRINITY_DN12160_c0_g1_i1.p1 TRINITY_DN12160_c0_g1~~TRINITY_DN12160_c0_g1_i1.p1  ORF type:complete len:251 (+),score=35.47 TRINITY_DN12160_c0_g1_i1:83-835(+)
MPRPVHGVGGLLLLLLCVASEDDVPPPRFPDALPFAADLRYVETVADEPPRLDRTGPFPSAHVVKRMCSTLTTELVALGRLFIKGPTGQFVFNGEPLKPLRVHFHLDTSVLGHEDTLVAARPVLALHSLLGSLHALSRNQQRATALHIEVCGTASDATAWTAWVDQQLADTGVQVVHTQCESPKSASGISALGTRIHTMVRTVHDPNTIIFLAGADLLAHPEMVRDVVEMFHSHQLCVASPVDPPEAYRL